MFTVIFIYEDICSYMHLTLNKTTLKVGSLKGIQCNLYYLMMMMMKVYSWNNVIKEPESKKYGQKSN